MSEVAVLFSILGAFLLGAMSPGPSFIVVSRIAVAGTRTDAMLAALGMGVGGFVFPLIAVAGLTALLMQVEWLNLTIRLAGGAYLFWLGVRIWRGASDPVDMPDAGAPRRNAGFRSFTRSLFVQLSNPKTAIFYASMFAALLPTPTPSWLLYALPPLLFLIEFGWYTVVGLAFSSRGPRAAYVHSKRWIDRAAGAVVGALGLKLMADSVRAAS
ncbi:MAG TPA: LysE family transporter [Mesorhizobium sp.]